MPDRVTNVRNPYPVPDVSREGVWIREPVLGDKVLSKDRDWDIKLSTHERLFAHHTLNSVRRDRRLLRPNVPRDALDLALNSVYVHSEDSFVPKRYVSMQPETLGKDSWRLLRNEITIFPKTSKSPFDLPKRMLGSIEDDYGSPITGDKTECYRGPTAERRIHPSSVKLNIEGPHMDRSNPGYSRKIDGTFYSI